MTGSAAGRATGRDVDWPYSPCHKDLEMIFRAEAVYRHEEFLRFYWAHSMGP